MKFANLHLHSIYSDGIFTPQELCALAVQKGYGAVALTDHETALGCAQMHEAAAQMGLACLTGIEAYVNCGDVEYHLVGLGFDPDHPRMRAYTDRCGRIAEDLTRRRLDYCMAHDCFPRIEWNEVTARFPDVRWYCNEHIFMLLKEKYGFSDPDYWSFIPHFNGAPVRAESTVIPIQEMIDLIHAAGGVAILAHPDDAQLDTLPQLVAMGLDGVETDHPDCTGSMRARAVQLAQSFSLLPSGGTDHSGILGNDMDRLARPGTVYPGELPYTDVSNGADRESFDRICAAIRARRG